MGIIFLIVGIIAGWNISDRLHPENWGMKILYSLAPTLFVFLITLILSATNMGGYAAGQLLAPFLISCIAYGLVALFKIKIKNKND